MKKTIFILAAIAIVCAPAMAVVKINSVKSGSNVSIKYCTDGSGQTLPRSFALDISVSAGSITSVSCPSTSYYVYPGSVAIVNGTIDNAGSCICTPGSGGALGGGTGVTVEMASLYGSGQSAPGTSGTIVTFTLTNSAATVNLAGNASRTGLVLEDATAPTPTFGTGEPTCVTDCFPSGKLPDYNQWCSMGKPSSWCYPWQCKGDASGSVETIGKFTYHVANADLNILLANWTDKTSVPAQYLAADFSHTCETIGKFTYRVANQDLNILLANWTDKASAPGNCTTP